MDNMDLTALISMPRVKISPNGIFKYILINLMVGDYNRTVVRGFVDSMCYADILERELPIFRASNLCCECIGGGRIYLYSENKTIILSGSSEEFGRANHRYTRSILEEKYPGYRIRVLHG